MELVRLLAWQDIRQRYRRSFLGPFWITISNAVLIASIGLVFGRVLDAPLSQLLPSLAVGLTVWMFISGSIVEGCTSFVAAESIVKQLPVPLFVHTQRVVGRNLIVFAHNMVIIPPILFLLDDFNLATALLSVLGLLLLVINLLWATLLCAIICTRYRDLPQIIGSIIQVAFYVTPIIWTTAMLQGEGRWLLDANPFYHLIEIVRAPLLGQLPSVLNWSVAIAIAIAGWIIAVALFSRYRQRIVYWL